jgi:hypothetical protein
MTNLTPGQRLVLARWSLRQVVERWLGEPEPSAGSDQARELYGDLTAAARDLVTAQDDLDDAWAAASPEGSQS